MGYKITNKLSIIAVLTAAIMLFISTSCQNNTENKSTSIGIRDSLPILKSVGVSTLISDSGIIQYKIISEDLVLTRYNVFYLLIASLLGAIKINEDEIYKNKTYAKIFSNVNISI